MLNFVGRLGARGQKRRVLAVPDPIPLIAGGVLSPLLTFTRAHSSVEATALAADGVTWERYNPNEPRFHGTARALLVEGARTNALPNPRADTGVPGGHPDGWGLSAARGVTHTFTLATRNGVEGVLWSMNGTPDSALPAVLSMEEGETLTAGRRCVIAAFVELVAGTMGNISTFDLHNASQPPAGATPMTPSGVLTRYENLTTGVDTLYRNTIFFAYDVGLGDVDTTIFVGWPTREMDATFASTPILPARNTQGSSTRGADLITVPLAALGIDPNGASTFQGDFALYHNSPSGTNQSLLTVDDGTANNRFRLFNSNNTANIRVVGRVGAVDGASVNIGNMTPRTEFRCAAAIYGDGSIAGSFNGSQANTTSGGPTDGLTTLRVGHDNAGGQNGFCAIRSLLYLPVALSGPAAAWASRKAGVRPEPLPAPDAPEPLPAEPEEECAQ